MYHLPTTNCNNCEWCHDYQIVKENKKNKMSYVLLSLVGCDYVCMWICGSTYNFETLAYHSLCEYLKYFKTAFSNFDQLFLNVYFSFSIDQIILALYRHSLYPIPAVSLSCTSLPPNRNTQIVLRKCKFFFWNRWKSSFPWYIHTYIQASD